MANGLLPDWKPVFISRTKGTRWQNLIKVEKKNFKKNDGSEIEIERRVFESFVLYANKTAWMTQYIYQWECQRLSQFLRKKYPNRKFLLLVDNCPAHRNSQKYENLEVHFFPPGVTGYLQEGG